MFNLLRQQPRAFHMIFMLEIWERFGFYTVQGILVLYFIRFLGLSETTAYYTFGAFSALVYSMVAVGGYLGDRVIGTKRTLILGLVTLALGYLALALVTKEYVFFALGCICVGNGLFKANPASLLSKCYDDHDPRLHGGFTLYYMAVNVGAIVALFIGPTLSSRFGYSYAYLVSFIGLLLGLANYIFQRQHIAQINNTADGRKINACYWILIVAGIVAAVSVSAHLLTHVMIAKDLVWIITVCVIGIYFFYMFKETGATFTRMILAFILMVEAVAFFTLYQQMPTSLNLFAVNHVQPILFGLQIDPQSFQALNPIWIVIMSPLLVMLYGKLDLKKWSFPIPYKFAMGMTCCGLSFLVLFFARFIHTESGMVSSGWLVVSYFFQSLGELLVSALGVAMVAELVPQSIVGFVMGMWFLSSALAGFWGAKVASYTELPHMVKSGVDSLMIYTNVFAKIGLVTLIIAALLWLISPRLVRLMGE